MADIVGDMYLYMEDGRGRRGCDRGGGIKENVTWKYIFQCVRTIRGSSCNIQLSGVMGGH